MLPVLLLGLLGGGAALVARRLPAGQRPDDHAFPPGVSRQRLTRQTIAVSSGRSYQVSTYAGADEAGAERLYFVAERKGSVDWLSYLQARDEPERWLWSGSAPTDEALEAMRRDLEVLTMPQQGGNAS